MSSTSRRQQQAVLQHEAQDATLAALCDLADELGIWLLIGSLALKPMRPTGALPTGHFWLPPTDLSTRAMIKSICLTSMSQPKKPIVSLMAICQATGLSQPKHRLGRWA